MSSSPSSHPFHLYYLGSFRSGGSNVPQAYAGDEEKRRLRTNAVTTNTQFRNRSFEEWVVDHVEMAQLNGILPSSEIGRPLVAIQIDQNCVRLHQANSALPFERIPLHKIAHCVLYQQGDGVGAVLMENGGPMAAGSNRHQGQEYKFHLFQDQNDGREVRAFSDQLQTKFDEITSKVTTTLTSSP